MSGLSYLEKLLDGVEVEWLPLGNVCDFKNGFAFKSSLFKETGLPIVRITNIDGLNVNLDEVKYFSPKDYKENLSSFEVSGGDVLIAMSGATTGKVGIYKDEKKCYLNQRVGKFIPKSGILNNKFLYHFLLLNTDAIYILAGGGGQANLSSNALMLKLLIPMPSPDNPEKSLAIQSEIVRILDAFTALTNELTNELKLRKKQYNYYREQLLSFKEGEVEWTELGEIAKIKHGKDWKNLESGAVPVYGSGGVMGYVNKYSYDKPTVLIPRKGTITNIFYVDIPFWNVDTIYYTDIATSKIIPKYFYHFMKSLNLMALDTGSGRPSLTRAILNKLLIPIPCPDNPEKSLAIQSEIVRILDKFDTLTNSISEGLPREIELRKKQYEHYRNLLFSFPKPVADN